MKATRTATLSLLLLISGFSIQAADAQQTAISRADVLQHDADVPNHELIQARVDFEPGAASIKHSHPGGEIAYVLEGVLEYRLEGRAPLTLAVGEAVYIPAGVAHVATNIGKTKASELATYIVEKGKPLLVPSN